MSAASCSRCGVELRPNARFCGTCGHDQSVEPAFLVSRAVVRRATGSVALVFLGVLASLIAASVLAPEQPGSQPSLTLDAILYSGFVLAGLAAVALLGRSALRRSFAGPAAPRDLALGGLLGVALLVFNVAWLSAFGRLVTGEWTLELGIPDNLALVLLSIAVLPPLFEEWLCRGVLWTALEGIAEVRAQIFTTAILFAMLHGLNGAQIMELPSRFVIGLVLGWLRARTGSLWPGIAGHFSNNLLACFLLA